MKSKYAILASAFLISVVSFAQKDQIKAAEKALKGGNSSEAVSILQGAESLIPNATDAEKAQYFFVKGNALLDLANKKVEEGKNLSLAAKAYQDLLAVEKASGKDKYSSQATASILDIKFKLLNSAIADTKGGDQAVLDCTFSTKKQIENYKLTLNAENEKLIEKLKNDLSECEKLRDVKHNEGAKKLYDAYLLDKNDTINLYYAASTYVNGKNYAAALKLYEELKTLNYSGKGTSYLAMNKLTAQEDLYTTAKERDLAVKFGTHEKPKNEIIPSKRGEINKNIALILIQNGKTEEAKKAISEARKANPDDSSLTLAEANLYLETKDFETYKKLVAEVLDKNPNDADLIFNLAVLSANAKNPLEAENYYKRVMEINPNYINAYINLAALKLEDEKVIIDEMNKLGTSPKDMKRYDVLKNQRFNLFRSAIPYLIKAVEIDPTNIDVAKTLMNVYSALEMTEEYKALKAKIKK